MLGLDCTNERAPEGMETIHDGCLSDHLMEVGWKGSQELSESSSAFLAVEASTSVALTIFLLHSFVPSQPTSHLQGIQRSIGEHHGRFLCQLGCGTISTACLAAVACIAPPDPNDEHLSSPSTPHSPLHCLRQASETCPSRHFSRLCHYSSPSTRCESTEGSEAGTLRDEAAIGSDE